MTSPSRGGRLGRAGEMTRIKAATVSAAGHRPSSHQVPTVAVQDAGGVVWCRRPFVNRPRHPVPHPREPLTFPAIRSSLERGRHCAIIALRHPGHGGERRERFDLLCVRSGPSRSRAEPLAAATTLAASRSPRPCTGPLPRQRTHPSRTVCAPKRIRVNALPDFTRHRG
jgi:hypothetical protein